MSQGARTHEQLRRFAREFHHRADQVAIHRRLPPGPPLEIDTSRPLERLLLRLARFIVGGPQ